MCPLSMCAPHQACCYSTRLVVSVCYFSTPLLTVHMSHRLALFGCLGVIARASLMQSTAYSGEQDAEVPAGEDDH